MPTLDEFLDAQDAPSADSFLDSGTEPEPLSEEQSKRLSQDFSQQEEFQRNLRAYTGGSQFSPGGPDMDFARALYQELPAKVAVKLHDVMQPVEKIAAPAFSNIRRAFSPTTYGMTGEPTPEIAPGESYVQGLEPGPNESGIIASLRRAAAGMTTPGSLAILPLAAGETIPAKVIQAAFATGAGASIPGSIEKLATAKTAAETRGALTDIGLSTLIAGLAGSAAARVRVPEKFRLEDRGDVIRQMEERFNVQRQLAAGSPFIRERGLETGEVVPIGLPELPLEPGAPIPISPELAARIEAQRQAEAGSPFIRLEAPGTRPITMGVEQGKLPALGAEPTFEPSGQAVAPPRIEVPTIFQGTEPPSVMRPTPSTGRAAQKVRLQAEAEQRMADWQRAIAEKVSLEQQAPAHPDKPLTANQLRIVRESLERDILQGQIPGKKGLISGSGLEAWADQVLGDVTGPQEFQSGIPLKYAGAVLVKGAALLERGIVDAAKWTAEMVKLYGENIRPYLASIRQESDSLFNQTKKGKTNAIQQEATPAVRNVQQPEVTQEGAGQVPTAESSTPTAEARVNLPELRPGDRLIQIEQPDGTVIEAVTNGKNWEFGGQIVPNVGRVVEGLWSDGPLRPGEKIIEPGKGGDIIDRLESLKFPETGLPGELYTLRPDIIQKVGKQVWNDAISVAQGAIRAGRSAAEALESSIEYIRKHKPDFDEAAIRKGIQDSIKGLKPPERLGMAGQPAPQPSAPTRPAAPAPSTPIPSTEGTSLTMRKSAERATTSEMFPEPVQEQIKTAPESFYQQQSMKRVEDTVSSMSEAELAGVPRDSNLYTAAKLEQSRRLFARGENDSGYNVFVELEKEGTRLGQLINQFKLLKGTRPEDIVRVINQTLKKSEKDPLNKAQEQGALETAKNSKEADAELDKATDAWKSDPSLENAKKAEEALLKANKAALELQRFIGKFQPRSIAGIIKSVLQGNLLTPISETANIVGNLSFLPFRALDRSVASAFDVLDSYLTGRKREITVQPLHGPAEAAKGFVRGAKQIPDIFLRGTGDVIKGETRAGLHPIKAWINQFSKNPDLPTTGGKLTLADRIGLAIEGTFGVPAEAMLRGLGAGDVAFKEAARSRIIANELKLANVPREKWGFAQKFPELFLDAPALERIHSETMAAIFQRPSRTLNLITGWLRGRGEWIDLLAATVAPYKMTPWNIVGEILSYNPLIALGRAANDARLGNTRSAKLNAGKFAVGSLLTATGWWLYKNGLMSPSLDQRDEAQKARILAGEVLPPNHINLSGLKRKLSGGDPTFKKGDETVDVFRSGGLAGSAFYMTANIGRDMERQPEASGMEAVGKIIRESTLEQARFGMNQSFLSGVEGLLSAVREGDADNYIRKWMNTVASIPMPNSLTVMSRATRQYKPDFREETFKKQVENVVRNRLGFAKMDDYLPLKRGLWGEPLRETPKNRNALVYHFFDVFKNQQVTDDPVTLELFRIWRKTGDTKVIPSLVEEQVIVGNKKYPLTAAQQSRYAELVGKERRRIVDAIVVNPQFHKLSDENKIKVLETVYTAGLAKGKEQLWKEVGATLTPAPPRAGFQMPAQAP